MKHLIVGSIVLMLIILLAWAMPSAAQAPCSPANYTHITNTAPLPSDFCAFAYLPWRVNIPANPQHIDQASTTILQQEYAPHSGSGAADPGINVMATIHTVPQNSDQGNGNHPIYIASASDPLVTVDCSSLFYGCSDGHANFITSVPAFRIPPYARPSSQYGNGDIFMSVIQPNGDVVDIYNCLPSRDWQDGDTISGATCGGEGVMYANIVDDPGTNTGNINAGDALAALPVHFNEVMNGQINHALHVFGGCFTGGRYPGTYAMECLNPPGLPLGSHLWLSLTRAQIDALPTSVVPAHMRVFAYAAHEHGIYALDTGDGTKDLSQPMVEDALPFLLAGGGSESYWTDWFLSNGGGVTADANLKLLTPLDWQALAPYLYVLDGCYALGTCSDSIGENPVPTSLAFGQ